MVRIDIDRNTKIMTSSKVVLKRARTKWRSTSWLQSWEKRFDYGLNSVLDFIDLLYNCNFYNSVEVWILLVSYVHPLLYVLSHRLRNILKQHLMLQILRKNTSEYIRLLEDVSSSHSCYPWICVTGSTTPVCRIRGVNAKYVHTWSQQWRDKSSQKILIKA